jgi:hypothetical protein
MCPCPDLTNAYERRTTLTEPLLVGPRARTLPGWCRALTIDTDEIDTRGITRQDRFEADVSCPVGEVVVDVPEALAALPANIPQLHVAGIHTVTAVVLAVEMEVIQTLATPCEGDLQGIVEMRERSVAIGRRRRQTSELRPRQTTRR